MRKTQGAVVVPLSARNSAVVLPSGRNRPCPTPPTAHLEDDEDHREALHVLRRVAKAHEAVVQHDDRMVLVMAAHAAAHAVRLDGVAGARGEGAAAAPHDLRGCRLGRNAAAAAAAVGRPCCEGPCRHPSRRRRRHRPRRCGRRRERANGAASKRPRAKGELARWPFHGMPWTPAPINPVRRCEACAIRASEPPNGGGILLCARVLRAPARRRKTWTEEEGESMTETTASVGPRLLERKSQRARHLNPAERDPDREHDDEQPRDLAVAVLAAVAVGAAAPREKHARAPRKERRTAAARDALVETPTQSGRGDFERAKGGTLRLCVPFVCACHRRHDPGRHLVEAGLAAEHEQHDERR